MLAEEALGILFLEPCCCLEVLRSGSRQEEEEELLHQTLRHVVTVVVEAVGACDFVDPEGQSALDDVGGMGDVLDLVESPYHQAVQNIQEGAGHMARSLVQDQSRQEVGHILCQTEQGESSHRMEGADGSLVGRRDHRAAWLAEEDPVLMHSEQLSLVSKDEHLPRDQNSRNSEMIVRRKATEISTRLCAFRTGL